MCKLIILISIILAVNCENDCGILPSKHDDHSNRTFLPWQAGVYKNLKAADNSLLMEWWSGATLVSKWAVISAAHKVFYQQTVVRPATAATYSIGVGELPWPWRKPDDITSQYIQVASIHLAPGFHYNGRATGVESYSDDIAVLIGTRPFIFTETSIRPVCLNFDYDFHMEHVDEDTDGKTAIWASRDWNKEVTQYMEIATLFPVSIASCLEDDYYTESLDHYSVKIVTLTVSDKVCFEALENTSVPCNNDEEGVGIAYLAEVDGIERYYLWGAFSSPINDVDYCNSDTYYLFTPVLRFESFLKKLLYPPDVPQNKCVIPPPPYPEHGSYTSNITREENTSGGKEYELETLTVTCEPGYGVDGPARVSCFNGYWLQGFPKCVRVCTLIPHPSVTYQCLGFPDGVCSGQVPPGTLVYPRCKAPYYRSEAPLIIMSCSEDGYWANAARCVSDCGKVTPHGTGLMTGGAPTTRGELPWHVGVYKKTAFGYYQQVCGGSLISTTFVISAAHCFWSDLEKQLPAEQFAVAVGKLYRAWDDPSEDAQKSDVRTIHLPPRFQGSASNYQDDIAVLEVTTSFQYRPDVRSVCLSFDSTFERIQLQATNKGKVAGWGLTSANGLPSSVLRTVELPYVDVGTCIVESPPNFREYITSDKICAGGDAQSSFGALCKGDGGGGLSFPGTETDEERYYLRGVVSTAPNNEYACNTVNFTSFTNILKHEDFIKQFLNDQ